MELPAFTRRMSDCLCYIFRSDLTLTHLLLEGLEALTSHLRELLKRVETSTNELHKVLPHELACCIHLAKDKRQRGELLGIPTRDIRKLTHIPRHLVCLNPKREHLFCSFCELHSVKRRSVSELSDFPEHLICPLSIADKRLKRNTRLLCLHPYL